MIISVLRIKKPKVTLCIMKMNKAKQKIQINK